jgi:hypothetical protein
MGPNVHNSEARMDSLLCSFFIHPLNTAFPQDFITRLMAPILTLAILSTELATIIIIIKDKRI